MVRLFVLSFVLIVFSISNIGCTQNSNGNAAPTPEANPSGIKVTSRAFQNGKPIPKVYTCDGSDFSPPLQWDAPPTATISLVLLVDDPDAPGKTWSHWVLFNLPADTRSLPEHVPTDATLLNLARQGKNGFGRIGYGGPCPPTGHGPHRYFFHLYALDKSLVLPAGSTREAVINSIQGSILQEGTLMGTYERKR